MRTTFWLNLFLICVGVVTGSMSEHFSISSGYRFSVRNKEGYPELITDQSRNVDIMEKLSAQRIPTEETRFIDSVSPSPQ